ncbi:MAG: histidine kinase [Treponemataceae bacterium]
MSIKNRLFITYLVLISIITVYIGISEFASAMRESVDADRAAILELSSSWGSVRVLLNDMVINWDNGEKYAEFRYARMRFGERLNSIQGVISVASRWYYPADMKRLLKSLTQVWTKANEHLERVETAVRHPDFRLVENIVESRPGLQRLNHLWIELLDINTSESRRSAYLIQQLITEVEFFPIYGNTVDRLFAVLIARAAEVRNIIAKVESAVRVVFFLSFFFTCLWLASRFAHSLSKPIVSVTRRLYEFAGLTGAEKTLKNRPGDSGGDELSLLSRTVDRVITHYTDLSVRAGQLARGEVSDEALQFPREGIVGRSLDEIALYLRELSHTSAWIRDGEYGLQIRERSRHDVLTHNFNIMSAVIREKITTLQGMFEAVDEAVLVIDQKGIVLEANSQLYRLIGTDQSDENASEFVSRSVVAQLTAAVAGSPFEEARSNQYANLTNLHGHEVPIRISSRPLAVVERIERQCMFLIVDESWRARAKREQEKLRAQAAIAELKALRAQINPHFFFNTLNTIAHLIETDSEAAVGTVEHLADLFRYTLTATKRERVALRDELDHIRRYLDIEHKRRGDALRVSYEIDESLYGQPIPPMLLQPLVENAVRYGVDDLGTADLTITGKRDGEYMVLEVADRGMKEIDIKALLESSGTGIRNVNQRFSTIFGQPLSFRRNRDRGLVVSLRMPLQSV